MTIVAIFVTNVSNSLCWWLNDLYLSTLQLKEKYKQISYSTFEDILVLDPNVCLWLTTRTVANVSYGDLRWQQHVLQLHDTRGLKWCRDKKKKKEKNCLHPVKQSFARPGNWTSDSSVTIVIHRPLDCGRPYIITDSPAGYSHLLFDATLPCSPPSSPH